MSKYSIPRAAYGLGKYVLAPLAGNAISSYMKTRRVIPSRNKLRRRKTSTVRSIRRRSRLRSRTRTKRRRKQYEQKVAKQSGSTNTTTNMIVRKTPKEQRFLRKLFKTNPTKRKLVNRFGFSWIGNKFLSRTVWTSVTNLKYNNLSDYMKTRIMAPTQMPGYASQAANSTGYVANNPDQAIYIGKCTYMYELYNPTNYIMTVYIYDLVCKRDTPYDIRYLTQLDPNPPSPSSAPEDCMRYGTISNQIGEDLFVSDPTYEDGSLYNTVGMKPTDYHYFNTFWKVKGMKKIILPPQTSHHHNVIFNPKKLITQANLYFPHQTRSSSSKIGIAGITQSTLFGFEGQVATSSVNAEGNITVNNENVGTLPGKLIIRMVRKQNIWDCPLRYNLIDAQSSLKEYLQNPVIFTDLTTAAPAGPGNLDINGNPDNDDSD